MGEKLNEKKSADNDNLCRDFMGDLVHICEALGKNAAKPDRNDSAAYNSGFFMLFCFYITV